MRSACAGRAVPRAASTAAKVASQRAAPGRCQGRKERRKGLAFMPPIVVRPVPAKARISRVIAGQLPANCMPTAGQPHVCCLSAAPLRPSRPCRKGVFARHTTAPSQQKKRHLGKDKGCAALRGRLGGQGQGLSGCGRARFAHFQAPKRPLAQVQPALAALFSGAGKGRPEQGQGQGPEQGRAGCAAAVRGLHACTAGPGTLPRPCCPFRTATPH